MKNNQTILYEAPKYPLDFHFLSIILLKIKRMPGNKNELTEEKGFHIIVIF